MPSDTLGWAARAPTLVGATCSQCRASPVIGGQDPVCAIAGQTSTLFPVGAGGGQAGSGTVFARQGVLAALPAAVPIPELWRDMFRNHHVGFRGLWATF